MMRAMLIPRRLIMLGLFAAFVVWCAMTMNWSWLPRSAPLALDGLWVTIWLLVVTIILGFTLAVPLGLAQAIGPWYLAAPARVFCSSAARLCCCKYGCSITASARSFRSSHGYASRSYG